MTEVEQAPQNGIDLTAAAEDDESSKARPADIEQDMREMERRKRVEAIMGSKLFREELERIVDAAREGGSTGILQQLSDIVGVPSARVGSVFKATNCMLPINDIRGVESMGYAKGEKILRCKLAATFRLLDLYGWTQGLGAQITARLKVDQEYFLVNPYGLLYHEITASSLNKVDMQGQIVEQGTTNFGVNRSHFILHSVVHAARPDIRCAIYIGCSPVVAVSSLKTGLLPLTKDACVLGEISTHPYTGSLLDAEERDKLVRNLGPNSKVMLLSNHGALCCGETIEEAFFAACHIVQACETQLKLLPVGVDNLSLIPEESRKTIYEQSRRPPEDLEKKFAAALASVEAREAAAAAAAQGGDEEGTATTTAAATVKVSGTSPKWRVGGAEFEALMRMLDNAGYRTGYIYRHPLVKSEPPKPKNDVELPPAVSSLGYLLEEEELFRQGIWKKGDIRKGGDRSRWLNSPNVYQKVEVLETGTPDPKKITKWVAEGSPTHSTPVRIEDPLQFVPAGTNPKEFKRLQQQIKDNRRADKISAGPQSHILEGVTWDEANRIKDATVSSAGDHVVLMGAASKGIIQRGFQHNATVYKAPYAKNPFDNVTDDELNEYKRTVERKKKSIHGEYTDTDFSESEALSSLQTSGAQQTKQTTTTAAVSQSEPEDVSEHQVMRIETQQAPVPSQPEVVLSDATLNFINGERSHTATNQKPPTGRDTEELINMQVQDSSGATQVSNVVNEVRNDDDDVDFKSQPSQPNQANKENIYRGSQNIKRNADLIAELKNDILFQRQKHKLIPPPPQLPNPAPQLSNTSCINPSYDDNNGGGSSSCNSTNNTSTAYPNPPPPSTTDDDEETLSSSTNNNAPQLSNSISRDGGNTFVVLPSFEQTFLPTRNTDSCSNFYFEPYAAAVVPPPPYYEPLYDSINSMEYVDVNNVATDPLGHVGVGVVVDDHDNIYKKSLFCYTPTICDTIFEALQRPSHDNDLIFNIPFSAAHSPAPSTTGSAGITPRKCRADSPYKHTTTTAAAPPTFLTLSNPAPTVSSSSPYRTVSHFGFNSPQRGPQPEHKHIPLCVTATTVEPRKYVPIHKSISYEEIFSSPRYVDLCENCFEKIVRLKPELIQMQTRLRNIADFNQPNQHQRVGGGTGAPESVMVSYHTTAESASVISGFSVGTGPGTYDYAECCGENTETLPPHFSSQLEPVPEVEEADASGSSEEQHLHQRHNMPLNKHSESNSSPLQSSTIDKSTSNSTFIDKITRMNYSEESMNSNFLRTPRTVSSDITIELDIDDIEEVKDENSNVKTSASPPPDDLSNAMHALDLRCSQTGSTDEPFADDRDNLIELHASVTEIWEFGNWLEQPQPQEISLNQVKSEAESTTMVFLNAGLTTAFATSTDSSTGGIYATTDTGGNVSAGTNDGAGAGSVDNANLGNFADINTDEDDSSRPNSSGEGSRRRSLMSREERSRRKLEFQELWEDHITFFDGKDLGTLSDTESAIDETSAGRQRTQQQHQQQQQRELEDCIVPQEMLTEENVEEEVFLGCSLIVKNPCSVMLETKQVESNAAVAQKSEHVVDVSDSKAMPQQQELEDDEEYATSSDGCNSAHTYSVYRSHENLLFRADAASDAAAHSALLRMDNETVALDDIIDQCTTLRNVADTYEEMPIAAYNATIEEFELFKQNISEQEAYSSCTTKLQETNSQTENDKAEDAAKQVELAYAELVEDIAAGTSEDSSISDHFEEILIAVNNLQIAHAVPNTAARNDDDNNDDNDDGGDVQESQGFSAVERKILKKIEVNQLKDTEEIFDKIETSIRNKLTPAKFEQLVRKQQQEQQMQHAPAASSTPEGGGSQYALQLAKIFEVETFQNSAELTEAAAAAEEEQQVSTVSTLRQHSLSRAELTPSTPDYRRRSRSLTPRLDLRRRLVSPTPPPFSLNSTTSPARVTQNKISRAQQFAKRPTMPLTAHRSTHELHNRAGALTPTPSLTSSAKRNFVLENIRNAAIPRNNVAVKRLQGNAQAIFCRNPFGSGSFGASTASTATACADSNAAAALDNSPIYAFQSKLVRGSPRLWVSLAQTPPKKLQTSAQKTLQKQRRRKQQQQQKLFTSTTAKICDSTCSLDEVEDDVAEEEEPAVAEAFKQPNELLEEACALASSSAASVGVVTTGTPVDAEIAALGEQIEQIHPRLETYKRKLEDYGETVAKCARSMDECVATQEDLLQEQRVLRDDILLHQYVEDIACQVQTFSISETED